MIQLIAVGILFLVASAYLLRKAGGQFSISQHKCEGCPMAKMHMEQK